MLRRSSTLLGNINLWSLLQQSQNSIVVVNECLEASNYDQSRMVKKVARQPQPWKSDYDTGTNWEEMVNAATPKNLLPYVQLMRLNNPAPSVLLAAPGWWSICLATPPGDFPDLYLLSLFWAGALVMRSAGCTINDMWDRDLDRKVRRTKDRPLAAGKITQFQALCCLAPQLSIGLAILLQLNDYSKLLGAASMGLVVTYPLMKRFTYLPQLYLGLAMNWGALVGWSAVAGQLESPAIPLYLAGICWTLFYDTIYAHMDIEDDKKAGIKSSAILFGENTPQVLGGLATFSVLNLTIAGLMVETGHPYFMGVAYVAYHFYSQLQRVDFEDKDSCKDAFNSNRWLGIALTIAIFVDRFTLLYDWSDSSGMFGL